MLSLSLSQSPSLSLCVCWFVSPKPSTVKVKYDKGLKNKLGKNYQRNIDIHIFTFVFIMLHEPRTTGDANTAATTAAADKYSVYMNAKVTFYILFV